MTLPEIFDNRIGEIAALATVICWTLTGLCFEYASKKAGSFTVNIFKLYLAFILFAVFSFFFREGRALPTDATTFNWLWLSISGVIGFLIGDFFLFKAFAIMGSRTSMLIMALVPPVTAILGFFFLNETLISRHIFGMIMTTFGVATVILTRQNGSKELKHPVKGIICALIGMLAQAVGLILSKHGMGDYNAFAATHIRTIAGMISYTIVIIYIGQLNQLFSPLKDRKTLTLMITGTTLGAFLGIYLSLLAIQNTKTGIATTIMSIVPITIIPFSIVIFKEKVNFREIIGAIIAVTGTAIMFS